MLKNPNEEIWAEAFHLDWSSFEVIIYFQDLIIIQTSMDAKKKKKAGLHNLNFTPQQKIGL